MMGLVLAPILAMVLVLAPGDDGGSPTDPPIEEMIRESAAALEREAEIFAAEVAEYRQTLTENAPGSIAIRSATNRIVERGEVASGFLLELLRTDEANPSTNARDILQRLVEAGALSRQAPEVYGTLSALVRDRSGTPVRVRQNAAAVLFDFRIPRVADDLIELLPGESDRTIQLGMIRSLGNRRARAASDLLVPLVDDERPEIRSEAIRALGKIGRPEVVSRIVPHLVDESYEVRKAAYEALGRIKGVEALDAVHARLLALAPEIEAGGQGDPPARREGEWVLDALAEIGSPGSLAELKPLLFSKNWEFARKAQNAIRRILDRVVESGDAEAFASIAGLLEVEEVTTVTAALHALTALRCRDAIPDLVRLLERDNSTLAGYAADALGEIAVPDDGRVVSALRQRFKEIDARKRGRDPRLLERIAIALAKLGQPFSLGVVAQPDKAKLKKDPKDLDALNRLAELYTEARDYRDARLYWRKALALATSSGDRSRILYKIGLCYALDEDFDRADSNLDEARKLGFPFNPELFDQGELSRLRESESREVREYYKRLRRRSGLGPGPSGSGPDVEAPH